MELHKDWNEKSAPLKRWPERQKHNHPNARCNLKVNQQIITSLVSSEILGSKEE